MPIRDIPREDWPQFLESFSAQHRAWLARVEELVEVGARELHDERPLAAVTPERTGNRVSAIEISFVANSGASTVRVENPMVVRVHRTREGTDRALEIVDEEGHCTRLDFRATAPADVLDGLTPAEL